MFAAVQIIKDTSNRIGDIVDDGKANQSLNGCCYPIYHAYLAPCFYGFLGAHCSAAQINVPTLSKHRERQGLHKRRRQGLRDLWGDKTAPLFPSQTDFQLYSMSSVKNFKYLALFPKSV